jgi:hypothetical protein
VYRRVKDQILREHRGRLAAAVEEPWSIPVGGIAEWIAGTLKNPPCREG